MAGVSAAEAFLRLAKGVVCLGGFGGVGGVGAAVLAALELVAEGVFDLIGGFAEEVVSAEVVVCAVVGEALSIPIFDLEVVTLFRAEASALSEGDILLEARHALL